MPVCLKERNRTKKQQGWEELLVATSKHHVTWKRRTWIFLSFGGGQECWNPIPYLCFFVWSFAEFGLLTLSSLSSSSPNKRVKRFGKLWQENMLIILRIGWCFFFCMHASRFVFLDRLITYDTKVLQLESHCMFKWFHAFAIEQKGFFFSCERSNSIFRTFDGPF